MIALLPSREVAITLFSFQVHWYGVMYFLAFVLAYVLIPYLLHLRGLSISRRDISDILSWGILGVIIGGRLGFVLFYDPSYFAAHPLEILALWHGGMSSHGGFLGVAIALLLILKRKRVPMLHFADVAVIPIALGLMLGRLGNFINYELYGTMTTLPWGIAIPGVEGLRHPTQFYAMAKDLLLALLCFLHLKSSRRIGETLALFLVLYSLLRFTVEFFREQDYERVLLLTRGQALTVPLLVAGIILLLWVRKRPLNR